MNKRVLTLAKEVDSVLLEGEFKTSQVAFEEKETATRDFGRSLEVNPAVHFDELVVRAWLKVKFGFGSMNGMNRVARFVFANGDVRVKDVGNGHSQAVSNGHGLVGLSFHFRNLLTEVSNLGENGVRRLVIAGFLGGTDATGSLVLRTAKLIGFMEKVAPCLVEFNHFLDVVMR